MNWIKLQKEASLLTLHEWNDKLGKESHHHIKLVCKLCGGVETCRCSESKETVEGICLFCKAKQTEAVKPKKEYTEDQVDDIDYLHEEVVNLLRHLEGAMETADDIEGILKDDKTGLLHDVVDKDVLSDIGRIWEEVESWESEVHELFMEAQKALKKKED